MKSLEYMGRVSKVKKVRSAIEMGTRVTNLLGWVPSEKRCCDDDDDDKICAKMK